MTYVTLLITALIRATLAVRRPAGQARRALPAAAEARGGGPRLRQVLHGPHAQSTLPKATRRVAETRNNAF